MKTKIIVPLIIILWAAAMRLLPHPSNVAPITAMALFGGAYLNKRYAIVVPFMTMLLSDFFLGFHDTMLYVYGSFLLSGLIGLWLKKHLTTTYIFGASLLSSFLFFIITNFGVWYAGNLYQKNLTGLTESYFYALPFFRNTLLGDMFYTGLFFGSYALCIKLFYSFAKVGK